jgi:hypothetical protein
LWRAEFWNLAALPLCPISTRFFGDCVEYQAQSKVDTFLISHRIN